jgi:aryl-alcohol dehydrogenase-like predicted oxidoreductase
MKTHKLGKTDVEIPAIGIGTMIWLPRNEEEKEKYFETYKTCLDNGINFFDTAEIYGNGKSEKLLGEFRKRDGQKILISTKFAPPSKMNPLTQKRKSVDKYSPEALSETLNGSLKRLGVNCIDLYLIHVPPKKVILQVIWK